MRETSDFTKFKQRKHSNESIYESGDRRSLHIKEKVQRYWSRSETRIGRILWKSIDKMMTYEELLKSLGWQELVTIRSNIRLKGLSQLSKDELVKIICAYMPQNINDMFMIFSEQQREILNSIVVNKGLLTDIEASEHKITYWRNKGVVFSGMIDGERVLYIPVEILGSVRNNINDPYNNELIMKNQRWINTVKSLLGYYGIISTVELMNMMQKYTDFRKEEKPILFEVLKEYASYCGDIKFLGSTLLHSRLDNISGIRSMARDYLRLEHKPLSEEIIDNAYKENYYSTREEVKEFILFFLEEYDYSYAEAYEEIKDFIFAIKNLTDIGEIVNYLSHILEWKTSEHYSKIIEMLTALQQNVELWHLKGYSVSEYESLE